MKYLIAALMIFSQAVVAVTPVVVFDYYGNYILAPEIAEELKLAYVGGVLAMDRLYSSKKSKTAVVLNVMP
jgi:hypothetical protein